MFLIEERPPWGGEDSRQLSVFLASPSGEKFRRILSEETPSSERSHAFFPSAEYSLGCVAGWGGVIRRIVELASPEKKIAAEVSTALPDLDDNSAWNSDGTPKR